MRMSRIKMLAATLAIVATIPQRVDAQVASTRAANEAPAPIVIPMELVANRPVVRLTVNGQGPFAFFVGPEQRQTVISPELAAALKLKPPSAEASELTVDFGFGADQTVKVPIAIEDLARMSYELAPPMRPEGVISLTAWKGQLVTIDYPRWRVSLEPGSLPAANGKDVFALNPSGELHLPLMVGDPIDCHVDPLFPGGLVLSAASLEPRQLTGEPRTAGTVISREGSLRVREARLAGDVMLGPFVLKAPIVLLAANLNTATIGTAWLSRLTVTYDIAAGRVRIERGRTATTHN
jgi:hypothetical protein